MGVNACVFFMASMKSFIALVLQYTKYTAELRIKEYTISLGELSFGIMVKSSVQHVYRQQVSYPCAYQ